MQTLASQYQSVSTSRSRAHGTSSTSWLDLTGLNAITITPAEVQRKLGMVGAEKSFRPDGLHRKLLGELVLIISVPVCEISNKSLETGLLPED